MRPPVRLAAKRAFDIAVAAVALAVLAMPMLLIAWLVAQRLGRPVLFRQIRPGRDGAPFEIRKFRTMTDARDASGVLLPDSQRLTPFGAWLRSTSLDELPELLNVLRGEMSLVGPRPLLMRYVPRYSPRQARRQEMSPGITGLAQVRGRNAISWEEKFELDVWYIDNHSLWLDLRILASTVWRVVTRDGVNAPGEATMPEFMGSPGAPPDDR